MVAPRGPVEWFVAVGPAAAEAVAPEELLMGQLQVLLDGGRLAVGSVNLIVSQ